MATNHRNEPVNENNRAKTNAERMGLSMEEYEGQVEDPDGRFKGLTYRDLAEGWEEGSMTLPDGTEIYPGDYDRYYNADDYTDEGLPEEEPLTIERDEDGYPYDHSSLLPSQHRTGKYGEY